MNNQSILVTGASGFVGKALCEYLLHKNYIVTGWGRQPLANKPVLKVRDLK